MLRFCAVLFAVCLLIPSSVFAADAVIDLANVDEDFQYQGEYLGACGRCGSTGLQVVAMGNGEFNAVEYTGGLPGYGWPIGGERTKYSGKRDGGTLKLTGETKSVTIENGRAVFWANEGNCPLGGACKVHRQSHTLGWARPACATLLFDGSNDDMFRNDPFTDDGIVTKDALTKDPIGDMQLHVEFRLPYMPTARGQGRSNSGVYIQTRYEVQILDSFGLDGEFNEAGALYRQRKPDLNMCLPPLSWQTYDIWFKGPRFDAEGKKSENARITVWLNGVAVQDDVEVKEGTGAGRNVGEGTNPLPLKLQHHGNKGRFRNVWVIDHGHPSASEPQPVEAITSTHTTPALIGLLQSIGLGR
jgi:hypothetical protein